MPLLLLFLLTSYSLAKKRRFLILDKTIPLSIILLSGSFTNGQNACTLPSSPLATPYISNVTVANCTTLVVRARTYVSTSPKDMRFQVFTGGNYSSSTGVYCNTSNMNYTGSISGGYLYHNSNKPAVYGYNYYVLNLSRALPSGTVYVIARIGTSGNHSRYTSRKSFTVTPTSISSHPSNVSVCLGQTASFSVTASGMNLQYQWQISSTGSWANIPNATSSSYSFIPQTTGTFYVRCRVTGRGSCYSTNSSQRTLTISNTLARPSYVSASDGTYCDRVRITWGSVSGANSYTIRKNSSIIATTSNTSWSDYSASTNPTTYEVRANNSGCSSAYRSNTGYRGIAPSISSQPSSITICAGAPVASFSCNVNGGTGVWKFNGNSLGISSTTLNINNPTIANQGNYTYEISNSCGTVSSNTASLTIIPAPDPSYTIAGLTKVGQSLTLNPVSSGNHNWSSVAPNGVTSSTTNPNPTFLATERGTYEIRHSIGNLGCTASSVSEIRILPDYTLPRPVETSRDISYIADPVNSATGEFKYMHHLTSLAGVNSMMDFNIYYASQHLENQSMGYGWTHNWMTKLVKLSAPSGDMYVEFGDGYRIYFTEYTGNNPEILPSYAGVKDTLIKNSSGNYLLERPSGETYFFANSGKLLSVTDLNGNTFSLVYTGNQLTRIIAPGGRYFSLVYNGSGKLSTVSNQLGHSISFTYSNDNLIQLNNTRGGNFSYTYNANHLLLEVVDPRNIRFVQNHYDAQAKVIKQVMADGGEWNMSYNTPVLRATTVTNPLGNSRIYYYNENWSLIREVDELNLSTYRSYDEANLMSKYINQVGDSIQMTHDSKGNLTSTTSPMGKQTQSVFNTLNRPHTITNSLGINTGLNYDSNGNLTTINLPNTGQIHLHRNSNGAVSTVTDAEGRTMAYTYSPQGDVTQINTAKGNINMTYDGIGRLLTLSDQNSNTTSFNYDNYGNVLRITSPSNHYAAFSYDANGNLISARDKAGNYTYYAYNNKDQVITITDAMGRTTNFTRNLLNQITRIDYPGGAYTEYTYTSRGNVASTTNSSGTTSHLYNQQGLLTNTSFPNGYALSYAYDKDNYLIAYSDNIGKVDSLFRDQAGRVFKTKNSLGLETVFTLNDMGVLTGVAHAGIASSTYNVNLNGEVLSIVNPNANTTTNTLETTTGLVTDITDPLGNNLHIIYDNVGNPISITTANGVIETRTYNNDNYLTSRSWNNGYYENYTLGANGAILSITTADGTMSFNRNANYEPTSITDQNGNTIQYSINDLGLPDSIIISNQSIAKTYTTLGQEQNTTDWENDLYTTIYNTAGIQERFDYPNGITKHLDYRADGYLMKIMYTNQQADTLYFQHFNRDVLSNVIAETKSPAFIFNNLNSSSETYAYLANDAQSNGVYSSDPLGRMLTFPDGLGQTVTASYDAKNRLTTMQVGGASIQNYYDAGNFLVKQINNGVTKQFIWDYAYGLPRIVAEADANGTITTRYLWANGMLVARKDETSGQKLFYLTDALGNVIALADTNGILTDTYTYGNDGENTQHYGTTQQPFTWRGGFGVLHQFGNIYYVRQRWHDASSGRFLSQDPYPWSAANNQTMNRYVYGLNNPLMYVDINGWYGQEINNATISAAYEYPKIKTHIDNAIYFYQNNVISKIKSVNDLFEFGVNTNALFKKISNTRKWIAKTKGFGVNGAINNFLKNPKNLLFDGIDVGIAAYKTDMVQNFLYKQTPEMYATVKRLATDKEYVETLKQDGQRVVQKLKEATVEDWKAAVVPAFKQTVAEAKTKVKMVSKFTAQFTTNIVTGVGDKVKGAFNFIFGK